MPSVLQVAAGLAHAARTRRPKGVHHLLLLPVRAGLRQLGTRHRRPAWLRLGTVLRYVLARLGSAALPLPEPAWFNTAAEGTAL